MRIHSSALRLARSPRTCRCHRDLRPSYRPVSSKPHADAAYSQCRTEACHRGKRARSQCRRCPVFQVPLEVLVGRLYHLAHSCTSSGSTFHCERLYALELSTSPMMATASSANFRAQGADEHTFSHKADKRTRAGRFRTGIRFSFRGSAQSRLLRLARTSPVCVDADDSM